MFIFKRIRLRSLYPFLILILVFGITALSFSYVFSLHEDALYIAAAASTSKKIIILDAGHGGEDCGAIGIDGTLEKSLNLDIALELGVQLEENGYTVIYTRTEDKLLYKPEQNIKGIRKISDLKNRCEIAARYPEALFISLHMNSFGQQRYSGSQVYASDNIESRRLAEAIQSNIKNKLQPANNRKVKSGEDIYVLKNVDNVAILIECGFLSNNEECKKLSEKEYQKQLCFSIICGIIEYNGK